MAVHIRYVELCFPLIKGVRIRIGGRSNVGSESVLSGSRSRAVIHLMNTKHLSSELGNLLLGKNS